uniref:GST N-terminal domain-containing protein n=1 Tax=Cyclophora tenuis TaxID=216820 RepID=A0A7S1CY63_CYCTE|mmetsp:Transcript_14523/g.24669  ORF Transcript_14523/g.24669 Transcript_14523/m.24669 type:complete len:263 (+) Transcript_14523:69-857(+)
MGNDNSTANGVNEPAESKGPAVFKLFTLPGNRCPYSMRTHIVLLELNVPFTTVEIRRNSKPTWFLKINPYGTVPTLQHPLDGTVVTESMICNEYLCDLAREFEPDAKEVDGVLMMMPIKAKGRAQIRLLCHHVDTLVLPKLNSIITTSNEAETNQLLTQLENALVFLETNLQTKGEGEEGEDKDFFMGKAFSLADAHFLPFFHRIMVILPKFKSYTVPDDKFPLLLAWYARCKQRLSFKTSAQKEEIMIALHTRFVERGYKW